MIAPTQRDFDIAAKTVAGEARGETLAAQIAVAWSIVNRAAIADSERRPKFGTGSLASACLAAAQYSCWDAANPNRAVIDKLTFADRAYQRALYAMLGVCLGINPDPTGGAVNYWSGDETPAWANGKSYISIGPFKFLQNEGTP